MSQNMQRAMEVVELVAEAPQTLGQLSRGFEVNRSTVFRQVQTLERAGFVMHRSDGRYAVGARIFSAAQKALENIDLRRIAYDSVRALQQRVGSTVHLAELLENDTIIYVDKVESSGGVRMDSRIGLNVRPQAWGVGKVILSQVSQGRRDAILRDVDWRPYTLTTHSTRESLDAELQEIGERGWGVDNGEFEDFMNCVAAPITNSTGTVVAALSISSIKAIGDINALKKHLDELVATAQSISGQLG